MDNVDFSLHQNLITFLLFVMPLILLLLFFKIKKSEFFLVFLLILWHTLFSIFYYYFSLFRASDALVYYDLSLESIPNFYPGTPFVVFLSSILSKNLEASYFNVTLFFNIFGCLGLVLFFKVLKKINIPKVYFLILFLPSISFWSSAVGKDAIAFFSINVFLYSLTYNNRVSLIPFCFSLFLMVMVRPHIFLIMILSGVLYYLLKSNTHLFFKLLVLPILIVVSAFFINFVIKYVGLNDLNLESVDSYIEQRQSYNLEGGSSIDISSMTYPEQVFSYVFRPLPFEANNILSFFVSVENLIFLVLFIILFFGKKDVLKNLFRGVNLWLFMYMLICCSILAITTANMGIAVRHKWMFMPIFIYLLFYSYFNSSIVDKNR